MNSAILRSSPTTPRTSSSPAPRAATRLRDVPRPALFAALGWLAFALCVAATGAFRAQPLLIAPLFATAIFGTLIAWRRSPAMRAWTDGLDLRVPILLHVARIGFGSLFLIEHAAGRLPETFSMRGGIGDILAGALAIVAAIAAGAPRSGARQPPSRGRRALVYAFSIFGLADILLVFATAQVGVLVERDPLILDAIGQLPYSLLPTVVVPLVILTHILVVQRLRAGR